MPDYTLKTEIGDGNVPVEIEFEYFPGTPAKLTGAVEDSEPAGGPTLEVADVTLLTTWQDLNISDMDIWPKLIEKKCLDYVASIGEA